jgi:hypothetical protein
MHNDVQLDVLQRIMKAMRERDGESLKPKPSVVAIKIQKAQAEPDGDEAPKLKEMGEEANAPLAETKDVPAAKSGIPRAADLSDDELEELVELLTKKAAG